MSFDNPTNRGRALKIVEILGHVEKSATSNRAEIDEIAHLMAPAIDRLRQIGAIPAAITLPPLAHHEAAEPSPETLSDIAQSQHPDEIVTPCTSLKTTRSDIRAPQWASVREMAERARLSDLTVAMAVYLNRIDEALGGAEGGAA